MHISLLLHCHLHTGFLLRRWNNVLSDASRQMVIELFLGLRLRQHLPSLQPRYPTLPPLVDPASDQEEGDEEESPTPTPRPVSHTPDA